MYRERMNEYYPQVIRSILEFKAIIDGECPEFEQLSVERDNILANAYLPTMDENRIKQWESMLNIRKIEGSSVEDRRDTIIARIRGQGKLNTKMINTIVGTFTGGTAKSWVKDGTLYVEITPPPNNKQYIFENVERELSNKIPAHLKLNVSRNYITWEELQNICATWVDVYASFDKWEDVLLFVESENDKIIIISQPVDTTAVVDSTATFTVSAVGSGLTYQWQYRGPAGGDFGNTSMTGANTPTLSVPAITTRNGYQYRCRITDTNGNQVFSDIATLIVTNN